MPIVKLKNKQTLPHRVHLADSMYSRLIGLLGTIKADPLIALHIVPGNGVHTFGMKYPVDIVFLDKNHKVLHVVKYLQQNKITKIISSAKSIVEFLAGSVDKHNIVIGDYLNISPDEKHRPHFQALKYISRWPVNIFMALLWIQFVLISVDKLSSNQNLVNLGILIFNTIVLGLFLTRRESSNVSYRVLDWIIPIGTVIGSMLLRPNPSNDYVLLNTSIFIQVVGIAGVVFSLSSLGRSFGIIPANRIIKSAGAYGIVRHPLYISEFIFYAGFLIGNFSERNIILLIFTTLGQLWRIYSEEKLLSKDPNYLQYAKTVRYRLIPGLF